MAKPRPCSRSHACTPEAASSPNAEPPGEHHRVDALDRAMRLEQVGFARAWGAAAHVDRGDRGLVEHDRGHARGEARVFGIANPEAGHIGDQIVCRHGGLVYSRGFVAVSGSPSRHSR